MVRAGLELGVDPGVRDRSPGPALVDRGVDPMTVTVVMPGLMVVITLMLVAVTMAGLIAVVGGIVTVVRRRGG